MSFVSRVLLVACITAGCALSEAPETGVSAEQSPLSLRQLTEEVVKVHVKVHHDERHDEKHEEDGKESKDNRETVRSYERGTVRIDLDATEGAKKHGKSQKRNNAVKQIQENETEVKYEHGIVKISGKKDGEAIDRTTTSSKVEPKKVAAAKEKKVIDTATEIKELATKLSSAASADKSSFHDAYGPIVVICGIIGGLAAIVGVAGLVMDQPQTKTNDYSDESAEDDDDVEANVVSVGVQDDDSESDSDSSNAEDGDEVGVVSTV
uniref:RxLR effector candidate protein n=1 Tax=Hyaloperonospora arabidopsidis (strain Emoy2) TaxID=559515 RepID=M4C3X7_HYAAE